MTTTEDDDVFKDTDINVVDRPTDHGILEFEVIDEETGEPTGAKVEFHFSRPLLKEENLATKLQELNEVAGIYLIPLFTQIDMYNSAKQMTDDEFEQYKRDHPLITAQIAEYNEKKKARDRDSVMSYA